MNYQGFSIVYLLQVRELVKKLPHTQKHLTFFFENRTLFLFFFFSGELVNYIANVGQSYGFNDEQSTPACIKAEILIASFSV